MSASHRNQNHQNALALKAFYCTSSCAEAMQGLALIFSVFSATRSSILVGIVGATAYLPGVIASIVFRSVVDRKGTERHLSISNFILVVGSLALLLSQAMSASLIAFVATVLLVQSSLSIVKAFNKAFVGRVIRLKFPGVEGARVLQKSTALGIVGGLVGAGCAGLLIDVVGVVWCFALTCALYCLSLCFANVVLSHKGSRHRFGVHDRIERGVDRSAAERKIETSGGNLSRIMVIVLMFTVPSSAFLPYIDTMIAPLADLLVDGSTASYLSLLSVSVSVGGVVAGACLSFAAVPLVSILKWSLPLASASCFAFVFVRSPFIAPILLFLCAFFGTVNVLAMQVLTNQAPTPSRVGSFTLLRNAFAGLAKAGASLLAGVLISVSGVTLAWSAAACCLLLVGGCWFFGVRDDEVRDVLGQ